MKTRGFTLVELLGVLAIIAIISILVFPSVTNIIDKSTDTVYQRQINTILKGAYDYTLKNTNYLPDTGETNYLTLGQLKNLGLVDMDITDPNTNEKFKDNLVISISQVSTNHTYDKKVSLIQGNYLYKIEFDNLERSDLLPIIELEGLDKNTNNDYILNLDLNEEFDNINYSARSSSGEDITDRVGYYITMSDVPVESIDTSKTGIYKVHYFVVDKDGYSNLVILNVIINDITGPTINLPSNNTLSINESYMDLNEGVSCTDNSGDCNVTVFGNIDYGTSGKYIIEYTAKDPSGNTTKTQRVITVE